MVETGLAPAPTMLPAHQSQLILQVMGKTVEADGVVSLALQDPAGDPLPTWTPGAHIDLMLDGHRTRQYSLVGDISDRRTYRIGVLREESGSGTSLYIHDTLQEGDQVRVSEPRNHFPLLASPRYLFIAGGIGITPIIPMIAAAHAAGAQWSLAYGGRDDSSMAFRDQLMSYGERVTFQPHDRCGLLDLQSLVGLPQPDTLVYCCGPELLMQAVEDLCRTWPADSLHLERFNPRAVSEDARDQLFQVELAASQLLLDVPVGRSILEVVEAAGISVLTSCEEGTCGTCETAVLSGLPDHRDSVLTAVERQAGDCMMICVSRSRSAVLTIDL